MSNTTFASIKKIREPFSSLSLNEGVIFDEYNRIYPQFVFSQLIDYDKLKRIKLETDGVTTNLRDSSGNVWSLSEDIKIFAAELITDKLNDNNLSLVINGGGPTIINNPDAAIVKSEGVRVYAVDDVLGTSGKPTFIHMPSTRHLIVSDLTQGVKAYVTVYYQ